MKNKKTGIERIKERLDKLGYIDNFWCIDNRVTTRLGDAVFRLKKQGYNFGKGFYEVKNGKQTKNFIYPLEGKIQAPKKQEKKTPFVLAIEKLMKE